VVIGTIYNPPTCQITSYLETSLSYIKATMQNLPSSSMDISIYTIAYGSMVKTLRRRAQNCMIFLFCMGMYKLLNSIPTMDQMDHLVLISSLWIIQIPLRLTLIISQVTTLLGIREGGVVKQGATVKTDPYNFNVME